jgi:hypothetical protein
VDLGVAFRPHAAQRPAQHRGELVPAISNLPHCHAGGQVDVGAPAAAALAGDRRHEPDRLGVAGQRLVDPGQAEDAQGADHHLAGEPRRLGDDHGPVQQRPIGRAAGDAEGGHHGREGGPTQQRRRQQQDHAH